MAPYEAALEALTEMEREEERRRAEEARTKAKEEARVKAVEVWRAKLAEELARVDELEGALCRLRDGEAVGFTMPLFMRNFDWRGEFSDGRWQVRLVEGAAWAVQFAETIGFLARVVIFIEFGLLTGNDVNKAARLFKTDGWKVVKEFLIGIRETEKRVDDLAWARDRFRSIGLELFHAVRDARAELDGDIEIEPPLSARVTHVEIKF
jgi:hypothetical protein